MSPKKPYQKRLPTVLPPAPRRSPAQDAVRPRPAPPRPRRSPQVAPPPVEAAQAAPDMAPAPPASAHDVARVPDGTTRPTEQDAVVAPPTEPDVVAPAAEPVVAPADRPAEPAVVTPPPPQTGPSTRTTLALVAAALVGVLAGGIVAWQLLGPDEPSASPAASLPIDGWPIAGESRAVTEVLPGGDLQVTHWIHAEEPIDELGLALPDLDGADVSATEVEVTADGRAGSGPTTVSRNRATYTFADATRVQVRYRMSGATQLSSSADGRGLATTTSLDVTAAQPRDVRVVRSQEVLSLACARADVQPVPCGQSDGDGQWRVALDGDGPATRVLAVVTVPS